MTFWNKWRFHDLFLPSNIDRTFQEVCNLSRKAKIKTLFSKKSRFSCFLFVKIPGGLIDQSQIETDVEYGQFRGRKQTSGPLHPGGATDCCLSQSLTILNHLIISILSIFSKHSLFAVLLLSTMVVLCPLLPQPYIF